MVNIQTNYDLDGIKTIIRTLCDSEGLSEFELAKRSGLNPASIYNLMKKIDLKSPGMRKSTLRAIGTSFGYKVSFTDAENQILLTKDSTIGSQRDSNLDHFFNEIKMILTNAGKMHLSDLERDLIKKTLSGMLTATIFRKE